MKVLTKFLILIALLIPNFCLAMGGDEIDLGPIRYTMKFVGDDNKIIPEYRDELLAKTGVNGNIEYWDKFKGKLTTHQMKGSFFLNPLIAIYFPSTFKIPDQRSQYV